MAMLLAMFQKMRLIRERNQLVLEQTQYSSKLTRVQKNSKRIQEIFASKQKKLENQASRMQKNATMFFQNFFNLGAGSTNPMNYFGSNAYIYNSMASLLGDNKDGVAIGFDKENNKAIPGNISTETFERMWTFFNTNGGFPQIKGDDGVRYGSESENFTEAEYKAFMTAKNMASQRLQQDQWQCQQLSQGYGENVSIWLEAEQAKLEAEQDEMLAPLSYEETMLELQKELTEQRLARIKSEIESYDQLCKDEVQNSAPKFGLG